MQITFIEADIRLTSFPHTDAIVIIAHIDKWHIMRVLVDNGSQAEILFLSSFKQMGFQQETIEGSIKASIRFQGQEN
jgi:hypothetical protein